MTADTKTGVKKEQGFIHETDILQELRYLEDEQGNRTAVLIPIEHWHKIRDVYLTRLDMERSILSGLEEVKQARTENRTLKSARDFLDEL